MFSSPYLHGGIFETLPRYTIDLGFVMKLFWSAFPYALELLVKSLENSDGFQITNYITNYITILQIILQIIIILVVFFLIVFKYKYKTVTQIQNSLIFWSCF